MFKSKYIKSLSASIILASSILLTTNAEASKNFTDISADPSHAQALQYFNNLGVYDYKQGTKLNGSKPITRSEVATVLHAYFKDTLPINNLYVAGVNGFKDVDSDHANASDIMWTYQTGIFNGDGNGNFNPNQTLTRAQMAKILVNAFNLETEGTSNFKDVKESHWAYDYISTLASKNYARGYNNGNFGPEDKVTLNQLSTFVYRILLDTLPADETPKVEDSKTTTPKVEETKQVSSTSTPSLGEVWTKEQILAKAKEMYDSNVFAPEPIMVKSKERVTSQDYYSNYNRPDVSFGRTITVSTKKDKNPDGTHNVTIKVDTYQYESEEQYREHQERTQAAVDYIKSNMDTSSDYTTIVSVAKLISDNLYHGNSADANNPYYMNNGSRIDCTEYSDMFATIVTALGYENLYIAGTIRGDGHYWNAVKVGSEWYYFDVTAYDTDGEGSPMEDRLFMTQDYLDSTGDYTQRTNFKASNIPLDRLHLVRHFL